MEVPPAYYESRGTAMTDKDRDDILSAINERTGRIEERCLFCHGVIKQHAKVLFGNGVPGIKTRCEIMWWLFSTMTLGGGLTGIVYLAIKVLK
jgi:hypothetical protein